MVLAPRTSGSMAGMFGGGGSGGWPSKRSITNAPRGTGEVVVPLAVIFKMAACVRNAAPRAACRQLHAANLRSADARNAVMHGQLSR